MRHCGNVKRKAGEGSTQHQQEDKHMGAREEASRGRPRTRGTKIGQGLTLLLAVALTATGVTVIWSVAEAIRVPLTAAHV